MTFEGSMENVALVFEVVGVAIIVLGGIGALVVGIKDFTHLDRLFFDVRRSFGRPIILGLEVLVAADIIKTITVDPSLESVAVLGILVAVRIALSISLDIEVDGMVPWRRAQIEREHAESIDRQ
jgi:uncharacterized membrane protein